MALQASRWSHPLVCLLNFFHLNLLNHLPHHQNNYLHCRSLFPRVRVDLTKANLNLFYL